MNTEHFKEKLEEERALIIKELGEIAVEGERGIRSLYILSSQASMPE